MVSGAGVGAARGGRSVVVIVRIAAARLLIVTGMVVGPHVIDHRRIGELADGWRR